MSGGGLPLNFEVLGGATLTASSVTSTGYIVDFTVSGVTYNDSYLDTVSGDPYLVGDPTQFYPEGFSAGVLKLIDTSLYTPGSTLIDFFYASGVTINTDGTGSATATFDVPYKTSYQFQLLYQTYYGTYNSLPGNLVSDIINPYNVSFAPPSYGPNGLFGVDTTTVTPVAATYASISIVGARYNGELLGSTGSIVFYQNQGSSGTTIGGNRSDAVGITLNTISNFLNGAKTATINYPPGPTFDTSQGDYYMVYDVNSSFGSSNYVNVSAIDLPVDASTSYDTVSNPGVTLVTLTNLTYNFRSLNPGDTVGISIAGSPAGTPPTIRSVSPARSVTFAAINARRSSGVYYSSATSGLSRLSYLTPAYTGSPEALVATQRTVSNIPNAQPNDGIQVTFGFDYLNTDGLSIFSTGSTGIIQLRGNNAAAGFSQDIPVSSAGNYVAVLDRNLTSAAGIATLDISFYDLVTGSLRTATNSISPSWRGLQTRPEKMLGSARGFIQTGETFTYTIGPFDYKDTYNYSLFAPNYIQRSPSTGVTYAPYVFDTQYAVQGGTFINIGPNIGAVYNFGVTANYPFFPGSTITGGDGANTFTGKVFLSTLSNVFVEATTFSSPSVSSNWGLTGSYAVYNGTTGTINIIQSPNITLASFPYEYGTTTYTGISNRGVSGSAGSAPGITYGVYFVDSTGIRSSFLPMLIQNMATAGPSGNTGYGPNGNPGATGVTYINGGGTGAVLQFGYVYDANAGTTAQYQVLGELVGPLPYDYGVSINVPANDMSRMLIYQSAWNILDEATGYTLQGYLGGGAGSGTTAGVTLIDPLTGEQYSTAGSTAWYGPHIAFLLGSVLDNIQLYDVDTSSYSSKQRLTNVDSFLSTTGATSGTATFPDDGGRQLPPVGKVYGGKSFVGATAGVLSFLPSESIASVTNTGFEITDLKSLFVDIDTRTGATASYVPALHNIFEQAVAFNKVGDSVPVDVSNLGFSSSVNGGVTGGNPNIAAAWNNGLNIYGVTFAPGDTATLYVKYEMNKVRQFQVSPWVTIGLDPSVFSVGQVLSINVGGSSISLPLNDWHTEKTDAQYVTYAVNLVATERTTASNFD
jgi:hypothetical protein